MNTIMRHITSTATRLAAMAIPLLTACSDEQPANITEAHYSDGLTIFARLNQAMPESRAVMDKDYSCMSFSEGDVIGFYAQAGTPDGNGLANAPMSYGQTEIRQDSEGTEVAIGGTFISDDINIDFNTMGGTCAYFPYDPDMEGEQTGVRGMAVRGTNGICKDLLVSPGLTFLGDGHGYTATFHHAFAILMLQPGKGFEHFMEHEVKVNLNKAIERVAISTEWPKRLEFIESDDPGFKTFTGAKGEWWERYMDWTHNKYIQEKKGDVYCVILPTDRLSADETGSIIVESIEVTDDLGRPQTIRNVSSYIWGSMLSGLRYPITLKMDEQEPYITPHDILPWGDEVPLHSTSDAGINTLKQFQEWLTYYNQYCKGELKDWETVLSHYGSYVNEDGESDMRWHFVLNADINCADFEYSSVINILTTFNDVLDGRGHTISNLTLNRDGANSGITGFVGTLLDKGIITNLTFRDPKFTGKGDHAGIIAGDINGGEISNCTITGMQLECAGGAVGGVAGRISSGNVSNVDIQGVMFGASTADKVSGIKVGGTYTSVNATNAHFGQM